MSIICRLHIVVRIVFAGDTFNNMNPVWIKDVLRMFFLAHFLFLPLHTSFIFLQKYGLGSEICMCGLLLIIFLGKVGIEDFTISPSPLACKLGFYVSTHQHKRFFYEMLY